MLGVWEDGRLRYTGNVGTGFNDGEIEKLWRRLRKLEQKECPFDEVPKMPKVRRGDVVWVRPELVCEVEFVEWTHDGRLRAPSYQGLREDKPATEVRRERPPIEAELKRGSRVLKLSNLDKPFWPDEGITKGDLLAYYRDVAPVLVPHLRNRPFTMKRYPDGAYGKFFFQKDAPKHMPDWIPRFRATASTRESPRRVREIDFALVNDELALLWTVNMGCIDMNTWYSRVDKPDRPDFVLFDLDPSPDVGFAETIQVALLVKQTLDLLGLESFPKTSGSEGIHVLVPIDRRHTFDETREFSEIVAGAIARAHPGLATTQWVKAKRRGVLIDSNQNGEGKTIASVYSVRPKPGAPVSTPLRWDEVNESLDPAAFTMDAVLERIARHGDLFEGVLTTRQALGPALRSLRLEISAREAPRGERQHADEVDEHPDGKPGAVRLAAAERPQLDSEACHAACVDRQSLQRVLIERLERQRPRSPLRDGEERLRADRLADLPEQAADEPGAEEHEDRDPVRGRGQEDGAEERERDEQHHRRGELEGRCDDAVGRPATGSVRDQHRARIDERDVHRGDGRSTDEPAQQERRTTQGPHDERLQEPAFGVAADSAEREEDGEHGAEEERREHRHAEERRAHELVRLDADRREGLVELLVGLAGAEPVEEEERDRQERDDDEDTAAEALPQRVRGDRDGVPHASSPTASR